MHKRVLSQTKKSKTIVIVDLNSIEYALQDKRVLNE